MSSSDVEPTVSKPKPKREYEPWTSRNALQLLELKKIMPVSKLRDVVFRKPVRVATRGEVAKNLYQKGAAVEESEDTIEGRPHQEEAYLIFQMGEENKKACTKCSRGEGKFTLCVSLGGMHHGACANCVFQSTAVDCACAVKQMLAEASAITRQKDAKKALGVANARKDITKSPRRPKMGKAVLGDATAKVRKARRGSAIGSPLGEDDAAEEDGDTET